MPVSLLKTWQTWPAKLYFTAEEQAILQGGALDRDLYMQDSENRINAKKLLSAGKWITLRTHTRFLDFPEHTHDYIEVV